MRVIERLRIEALEACKFRGHKMRPFDRTYRHWWSSDCRVCKASVNLNDEPAPNGIDIAGPAVAMHCPVDPKWL